eukprot:scaffold1469_cov119-Cylindrotheca_fusiformis.AAC.15
MDRATSRKPSVRFDSFVMCRQYHTSDTEKGVRWYSLVEMQSHRQRDRHLQTTMEDADRSLLGDNGTENILMYGLRTVQENKSRKRLIKESIASILNEQYDQQGQFLVRMQSEKSEGTFQLDPEAIAECYLDYSKKSGSLAYKRGMQTARQVQEFMKDGSGGDTGMRHSSKWNCDSKLPLKPGCSSHLLVGTVPNRSHQACQIPVRRHP